MFVLSKKIVTLKCDSRTEYEQFNVTQRLVSTVANDRRVIRPSIDR